MGSEAGQDRGRAAEGAAAPARRRPVSWPVEIGALCAGWSVFAAIAYLTDGWRASRFGLACLCWYLLVSHKDVVASEVWAALVARGRAHVAGLRLAWGPARDGGQARLQQGMRQEQA